MCGARSHVRKIDILRMIIFTKILESLSVFLKIFFKVLQYSNYFLSKHLHHHWIFLFTWAGFCVSFVNGFVCEFSLFLTSPLMNFLKSFFFPPQDFSFTLCVIYIVCTWSSQHFPVKEWLLKEMTYIMKHDHLNHSRRTIWDNAKSIWDIENILCYYDLLSCVTF